MDSCGIYTKSITIYVIGSMDKKTSKKIDEAVSEIRIALYNAALKITDEVQREIETRLIETIHARWEYMDKQLKK